MLDGSPPPNAFNKGRIPKYVSHVERKPYVGSMVECTHTSQQAFQI
jgi:hypothetical protein